MTFRGRGKALIIIFIIKRNFLLQGENYDIHSEISLCHNCITPCCADPMASLVLPDELIKIAKTTKKSIEEFTEAIILDSKKYHLLKAKNDSNECVFLDSETQLCSIYENRPFDCRVFPFDIRKINGKFMWVLFTCNGQKNSDWSWTEKNLIKFETHEFFKSVIENLEAFGNDTELYNHPSNKIMSSLSFQVLREIKVPFNVNCKTSSL